MLIIRKIEDREIETTPVSQRDLADVIGTGSAILKRDIEDVLRVEGGIFKRDAEDILKTEEELFKREREAERGTEPLTEHLHPETALPERGSDDAFAKEAKRCIEFNEWEGVFGYEPPQDLC